MNAFILIVVLNLAAGSGRPDNSSVSFQEFNSIAQCQYAAKLIRDASRNIRSIQCINK